MPSGQFNTVVISVSGKLPLDKGHYISVIQFAPSFHKIKMLKRLNYIGRAGENQEGICRKFSFLREIPTGSGGQRNNPRSCDLITAEDRGLFHFTGGFHRLRNLILSIDSWEFAQYIGLTPFLYLHNTLVFFKTQDGIFHKKRMPNLSKMRMDGTGKTWYYE